MHRLYPMSFPEIMDKDFLPKWLKILCLADRQVGSFGLVDPPFSALGIHPWGYRQWDRKRQFGAEIIRPQQKHTVRHPLQAGAAIKGRNIFNDKRLHSLLKIMSHHFLYHSNNSCHGKILV